MQRNIHALILPLQKRLDVIANQMTEISYVDDEFVWNMLEAVIGHVSNGGGEAVDILCGFERYYTVLLSLGVIVGEEGRHWPEMVQRCRNCIRRLFSDNREIFLKSIDFLWTKCRVEGSNDVDFRLLLHSLEEMLRMNRLSFMPGLHRPIGQFLSAKSCTNIFRKSSKNSGFEPCLLLRGCGLTEVNGSYFLIEGGDTSSAPKLDDALLSSFKDFNGQRPCFMNRYSFCIFALDKVSIGNNNLSTLDLWAIGKIIKENDDSCCYQLYYIGYSDGKTPPVTGWEPCLNSNDNGDCAVCWNGTYPCPLLSSVYLNRKDNESIAECLNDYVVPALLFASKEDFMSLTTEELRSAKLRALIVLNKLEDLRSERKVMNPEVLFSSFHYRPVACNPIVKSVKTRKVRGRKVSLKHARRALLPVLLQPGSNSSVVVDMRSAVDCLSSQLSIINQTHEFHGNNTCGMLKSRAESTRQLLKDHEDYSAKLQVELDNMQHMTVDQLVNDIGAKLQDKSNDPEWSDAWSEWSKCRSLVVDEHVPCTPLNNLQLCIESFQTPSTLSIDLPVVTIESSVNSDVVVILTRQNSVHVEENGTIPVNTVPQFVAQNDDDDDRKSADSLEGEHEVDDKSEAPNDSTEQSSALLTFAHSSVFFGGASSFVKRMTSSEESSRVHLLGYEVYPPKASSKLVVHYVMQVILGKPGTGTVRRMIQPANKVQTDCTDDARHCDKPGAPYSSCSAFDPDDDLFLNGDGDTIVKSSTFPKYPNEVSSPVTEAKGSGSWAGEFRFRYSSPPFIPSSLRKVMRLRCPGVSLSDISGFDKVFKIGCDNISREDFLISVLAPYIEAVDLEWQVYTVRKSLQSLLSLKLDVDDVVKALGISPPQFPDTFSTGPAEDELINSHMTRMMQMPVDVKSMEEGMNVAVTLIEAYMCNLVALVESIFKEEQAEANRDREDHVSTNRRNSGSSTVGQEISADDNRRLMRSQLFAIMQHFLSSSDAEDVYSVPELPITIDIRHDLPGASKSRQSMDDRVSLSVPTQSLFATSKSFIAAGMASSNLRAANTIVTDPNEDEVLRKQQFRCRGCGIPLSNSFLGFEKNYNPCRYLGGLWCKKYCHSDQRRAIPARVIHLWDLTTHRVCNLAADYLASIDYLPLFPVSTLNQSPYQLCQEMIITREVRERMTQLLFWASYLSYSSDASLTRLMAMCQDKELISIEKLRSKARSAIDYVSENHNDDMHLLVDTDLFSMHDIVKISKGELFRDLRESSKRLERILSNYVK